MEILIADDDKSIIESVSDLITTELQDSGLSELNISTAESGEEALGKFKEYGNDLIIMDMSMPPGENGLITSKQIKEINNNVLILGLTNYLDEFKNQDTNNVVDYWLTKSDFAFPDKMNNFLMTIKLLVDLTQKRLIANFTEEFINGINSDSNNEFIDSLDSLKEYTIDYYLNKQKLPELLTRQFTFGALSYMTEVFKDNSKSFEKLLDIFSKEVPMQSDFLRDIKKQKVNEMAQKFEENMKLFNKLNYE